MAKQAAERASRTAAALEKVEKGGKADPQLVAILRAQNAYLQLEASGAKSYAEVAPIAGADR